MIMLNHDYLYKSVYGIQGPAEVTPWRAAGRVRERLARDGQQFERFT